MTENREQVYLKDMFGADVFNDAVMRERLPEKV